MPSCNSILLCAPLFILPLLSLPPPAATVVTLETTQALQYLLVVQGVLLIWRHHAKQDGNIQLLRFHLAAQTDRISAVCLHLVVTRCCT